MSLFKKLGKIASPLTFGVTDKLAGGKLGSGLENLIRGKKVAGTADSYTELDPMQKDLLSKYQGMMNKDVAGAQIVQQEKSAIQGAKDAEMKANQAIAQRGLEGSSLGLSGVINATRGLGDQLGAIRAQKPAMELQNLGNISSGVNSILGTRMFKQGQQGGRSGGLLPLIGAGVGGYFGGAGGAQIGAGIGKSLQG